MSHCELQLRGEHLLLDPQRAVVWPARRTLIVADTHFAKDDFFRRAGIAMPRGPALDDLARLTALLRAHACTRLLVLGDFLHAATQAGDSFLHAYTLWRAAHVTLDITVIAGNHDRHEDWGRWAKTLHLARMPILEGPFAFRHDPATDEQGFVICGHLHPTVRLGSRSRRGLRAPAFWLRDSMLVMPSFGIFTGGALIDAQRGDRIFVTGGERVIELPSGTG